MTLPARLRINAWTGDEPSVEADLAADVAPWALGELDAARKDRPLRFLAPPKINPRQWQHEKVGWGLILADRADLTPTQKIDHVDVPEPLRQLLRDRAPAPVFHYFADDADSHRLLHNFATDEDVPLETAPFGVARGCLPYYLLIYGPPPRIPWSLQYVLNTSRAVGRLDLEDDALFNYVQELRRDWRGTAARGDRAVVWAVDLGPRDITSLMRDAIAAPVHQDLASDEDLGSGALFLDGRRAPAEVSQLSKALADNQPALIVTTSHGMTGPLRDPAALRAQLGLPVDQRHRLLYAEDLLRTWQPEGAIWYAHACCSAGGDSPSCYEGLVAPGSPVHHVLRAVAGLGTLVAPLPRALLGASKPLRAFIGHVEPTSDLTLLDDESNQFLTENIRTALWNNLYETDRQPVGMAFRGWYRRTSTLLTQLDLAGRAPTMQRPPLETLRNWRLIVNDVRSLVLLGDPTVVLPPPVKHPPG